MLDVRKLKRSHRLFKDLEQQHFESKQDALNLPISPILPLEDQSNSRSKAAVSVSCERDLS